MHSVFILSVIFGGIVLALTVIGSTILLGIKIIKGGISSKGGRFENEEARVIQEIYEGLNRMEARVEALETLLMERDGKDRS
jgi:phage shock protein B